MRLTRGPLRSVAPLLIRDVDVAVANVGRQRRQRGNIGSSGTEPQALGSMGGWAEIVAAGNGCVVMK